MLGNKAPGFKQKPNYSLKIVPAMKYVKVTFCGQTIAESRNTLMMSERSHGPVYYFPKADVHFEMLEKSDYSSHCPFKGDASYWSILGAGRREKNAVWSYENPYDEVTEIAGTMAFYASKVDSIEVTD